MDTIDNEINEINKKSKPFESRLETLNAEDKSIHNSLSIVLNDFVKIQEILENPIQTWNRLNKSTKALYSNDVDKWWSPAEASYIQQKINLEKERIVYNEMLISNRQERVALTEIIAAFAQSKATLHEKKIILFQQQQDPFYLRSIGAIKQGLPPLGTDIISNMTSKFRNIEKAHSFNFIESTEFGILTGMELANLPVKMSKIWYNFFEKGYQDYNSESMLQTIFCQVLDECISLAQVNKQLRILPKYTLSTIQLLGNYAEVAVEDKATRLPICIIEVKHNNNDLSNPEKKDILLQQIYSYMYDLRYMYGLRFIFGMLTTYKQTIILWLEDSHGAAKETDKEKYLNLCRVSMPFDLEIQNSVTLYGTPPLDFNNPILIEYLASLMFKLTSIPSSIPNSFLSSSHKYPYLQKSRYIMKTLPKNLQFTYEMASSRTRNFYALVYFHRGGDGRVGLCTSEDGNLGVLKFCNPDLEESAADQKQILKLEADLWKEIWGVDARVIKLNKQYALLMPFAFHISFHGNGKKVFAPLYSWNKSLSEWKSSKDIKEDSLFDSELQTLLQNPEQVARKAIKDIVLKGYNHEDLEWRHVALLPIKGTLKQWTVKPILIDLTRISKIEKGDAMEYEKQLLKQLKLV